MLASVKWEIPYNLVLEDHTLQKKKSIFNLGVVMTASPLQWYEENGKGTENSEAVSTNKQDRFSLSILYLNW